MKPFIVILFLTNLCSAQSTSDVKSLHIDLVQYLEDSGEYALTLAFLPGVNSSNWYDSLEFHFTQPKYSVDSEYSRYDAPAALIERYFHTDRLHDMKLYSDNNDFVDQGIFQGFEYIDQNIESKIVAVYRKSRPSTDAAMYAICGLKDTLPACPPKSYENSASLQRLQATVLPKDAVDHYPVEVGNCTDFHFMVPQAYRSSMETENDYHIDVFADLYLEHGGEVTNVLQLFDGWLYWHIQPLAMNHNGYPIVLLEKAMMDSDWFKQSILIWNGIGYEEKTPRFEIEAE